MLNQLQMEMDAGQGKIHIGELPILEVNPRHLQWLLYQLLQNSLKFKHPERPYLIKINSIEKGGKAYIEVVDNGIGIKEEYQQRIFRIFQRLDKKSYSGTGIGLAICKKIVELYDGTIELQSKVDEGTKVCFHIPPMKSFA